MRGKERAAGQWTAGGGWMEGTWARLDARAEAKSEAKREAEGKAEGKAQVEERVPWRREGDSAARQGGRLTTAATDAGGTPVATDRASVGVEQTCLVLVLTAVVTLWCHWHTDLVSLKSGSPNFRV